MRRILLATTAILALSVPAFAQQDVHIEKRTITREGPDVESHTTIEKRTITRDEEPGSGSTVSTVVIAPHAPPAPQVETPPPPPRPDEAWVTGHWRWDPMAANFVWVHGHYMAPPRPRAAWEPGHWIEHANGWVWEEGHWD